MSGNLTGLQAWAAKQAGVRFEAHVACGDPTDYLKVRHVEALDEAVAAGNTRRGRALRRRAKKIARALAKAERGVL